jgi:predicted pyridoxine 5'-phosphate oxidase superfamily flavin-nucleotide-binding protein
MAVRLEPDEAWRVVAAAHTGIFTTLRRDATPIALPVWFVALDRKIFVAAPAATKKVARIANNPRASFLVEHGERWVELTAVHFTGVCEIVSDQALVDRIDHALEDKYGAFRTAPERLPRATATRYATRVFICFTPDDRFISWDNRRLEVKPPEERSSTWGE